MIHHSSPTVGRPVALITGASGGIGRELATLFARDGFDLLLVARSAGALEELGAELSRLHGVAATAIAADLADPGAPEAVHEAARVRGATVDVLVNNAGHGLYGRFAATELDTELRMIQLNVAALTHLTKRFLPPMLARGRGRILNVASTAAFQPGPLMSVYYATKAYVLSFSEALAEELTGTGVTVTCLAPGATRTGFQARARMDEGRLLRGPNVMDAADVARRGYLGLMRGERIVVPGAINKAIVQALRLSPRRLVTRVGRALNDRT
jgi:short-subunit dehydrogenase